MKAWSHLQAYKPGLIIEAIRYYKISGIHSGMKLMKIDPVGLFYPYQCDVCVCVRMFKQYKVVMKIDPIGFFYPYQCDVCARMFVRMCVQVSQHRDVIQTEYARVNVAKGKLENLCRELQKHSKAVAVSVAAPSPLY